MFLLDLLGKRWVLRILWEMRDGQRSTFRELQEKCGGLSPTILNARLKSLREVGFVALHAENGFCLTEQGGDLLKAIEPLTEFAKTMGH